MNSLMGRILDVNQIVQQLLDGGHPSSTEVRGCQDHLNSRYPTCTAITNTINNFSCWARGGHATTTLHFTVAVAWQYTMKYMTATGGSRKKTDLTTTVRRYSR